MADIAISDYSNKFYDGDAVIHLMYQFGSQTILNLNSLNPNFDPNRVAHALLDEIPSADVQPVVHGEWIDIFQREDTDTSVECRCSICEKASRRPVGKYCKWCGARMDGGT